MKTKTSKTEPKNQNSGPFFLPKNGTGFIGIQAKYTIGKPSDAHEIEADQVAERVANQENTPFFSPAPPPTVQRLPEVVSEKTLNPKAGDEKEKRLMPQGDTIDRKLDEETEQKLNSSRGNGTTMDTDTQIAMENSFGANFSNIKIHSDAEAGNLNKHIGAQAFTTGNDIYFNQGKYNPLTKPGKQLLAHELTHTIQQGASSTLQNKPLIQRWWPWNTSTPEETREAEKQRFRSRNYGPITYTQNAVSGSGFEASYSPAQSRLNVTVRGKVRFKDTLSGSGGTFSSPNHFMNTAGFIPIMNALPPDVQSRILPYFRWTEDEKQIHMIRFRANIASVTSMWQNTGMSFQVNETGWEDITATPTIRLDITEGDAANNTAAPGGEATSDHLQIEIVKQPSASDVANITRIINEHNAATGATVTNGMLQGVRSYCGNDPSARGSAPEGFNNIMSLESNRLDDPGSHSYLTSVNFANNESQLSEGARADLDAFFADPEILMNNGDRGVDINLNGYASAPGTSNYNRSLVERRLMSVKTYINSKISSSTINSGVYTTTQTNDSDSSAESDLATNPATHDPASFRRVDISVRRQGRGGQNVLAHEMGHVFGLGDEYAEVGNGYNRPTGSAASHDQLAKNAGVTGGATVGNDNRMMSTGNTIGAAHYSTFADALNRLTSKSWRINS